MSYVLRRKKPYKPAAPQAPKPKLHDWDEPHARDRTCMACGMKQRVLRRSGGASQYPAAGVCPGVRA